MLRVGPLLNPARSPRRATWRVGGRWGDSRRVHLPGMGGNPGKRPEEGRLKGERV